MGIKRDYSVVTFLALTFAWTYFFHAVVILWGLEPRGLVYLVGIAGPTLVAVILVHRSDESVADFLRRGVQWKASPLWYVVAFSPAIIRLVGFFVQSASEGNPSLPPLLLDTPVVYLVAVFFTASLCEEYGWRGYALPRLQARFGSAGMGLVLGIVWGLWHIPHFLMPGSSQTSVAFEAFLLNIICGSFILALLYNRTRGSIFIAMIFHGVNNVSDNLIDVPSTEDYVLAVYCVAALLTLPFLPRPLFRFRAP